MRYQYTYSQPTLGFGRPWTPAVRALILACSGVFLGQALLPQVPLAGLFGLDSARPIELWRLFTYLFLHGGPFHLLFNMFALWIFGSDLEERLGTWRFVTYYFFTGVGAGVSVLALDLLAGRQSLVIGASGAIFGLLVAYGMLFAERVITLLLFFILPVSLKARTFVILYGVLELFLGVSGGGRTAHFAHLGGMLFGYLYLKAPRWRGAAPGRGPLRALREWIEKTGRARDDRRMDELLRKVNASGIGSLSAREKRFLHRMSRSRRWQ